MINGFERSLSDVAVAAAAAEVVVLVVVVVRLNLKWYYDQIFTP